MHRPKVHDLMRVQIFVQAHKTKKYSQLQYRKISIKIFIKMLYREGERKGGERERVCKCICKSTHLRKHGKEHTCMA